MSTAHGRHRTGRTERIAWVAAGMASRDPELIAAKPGRAERTQLSGWLAGLWRDDEYTALGAGTDREGQP